jgi:hypothetical protein
MHGTVTPDGRAYCAQLAPGGDRMRWSSVIGDFNVALAQREADAVALHEISHRMEFVVPDLQRIEDEYVRQRRQGDAIVKLKDVLPGDGYRDDEVMYRTDFSSRGGTPYSGKVYDRQETAVTLDGKLVSYGSRASGSTTTACGSATRSTSTWSSGCSRSSRRHARRYIERPERSGVWRR